MKKLTVRIFSLLMVLCLLFLSGCRGESEPTTETPEEFWARPHEWQSQHIDNMSNSNEYGYYFVNDNSSNLMYFDYETRQTAVLCNKVGCKHNGAGCEACMLGGFPYIFFCEDKLCLIMNNNTGTHIYSCDLDATNREDKILLMKDEMEKGNAVTVEDVLVNGDDLYYRAAYQEQTEKVDGKIKEPIRAVRHIDLKTWKEEEICRSSEMVYGILGADADGVLIQEITNFMVADEYAEILRHEETENGELLMTLEDMEKVPVRVFYWNKKSGGDMNIYQTNYRETRGFLMANGSCIYRLGRPEGVNAICFEKMDMHTGAREWLWYKDTDEKSSITNGKVMKNHLMLNVLDEAKMTGHKEFYTKDGFKKVTFPFLKEWDSIHFEDEHGYIVSRAKEELNSDGFIEGDSEIFVPIEEADRSNPNYSVLVD